MRGTERLRWWSGGARRITPARAGNSETDAVYEDWQRDHPRACGEQLRLGAEAGQRMGSPPRVRGTVVVLTGVSPAKGITPARAGNRAQADGGDAQLAGSPPRVRGTVI